MSENKTTLQGHNERLSALVEQVESLPDAGGGDNIVLQSKTVSPSTDAQTVIPDDGYNGLSQVTVNAIKTQSKSVAPSTKSQTVMPDSDYDGLSQVVVDAIRTQPKSIMPLTTLQTIKPDSGYDGLSQVIVNAMPTATQATPSVEVSSSGLITASSTQSTGYVVGGTKKATKQLTTQGEKIVTPSTNEQTAVSAGVYTTGVVKVGAIPSNYIIPANTKSITSNGTYDIASYAKVSVDVPVPNGYVYPNHTYVNGEIIISPGDGYSFPAGSYLPYGHTVTAADVLFDATINYCRYDGIVPESETDILIPRSEIDMSVYSDENVRMIIIMVSGDYMANISAKYISGGIYSVDRGEFFAFRAGSSSRFLYYTSDGEISYSNDSEGIRLSLNDVIYLFDTDIEYEIFLVTTP